MGFLPISIEQLAWATPSVFFLFVFLYYLSSTTIDLAVSRLMKSFSESRIAKNTYFRDAWKRYAKTFVTDSSNTPKTADKAQLYFNEATIFHGKARLRLYTAFPTLIFGLGVVAMFAGLIYGVLHFELETHDAIITSMKLFFTVMGASFVVFLVSLLVSAFFKFINRLILQRINAKLLKLTDFLDERYNMSGLEVRKIAMKEHLDVLKQISQGSNGVEAERRSAQDRLLKEMIANSVFQAETMERISEKMADMAEPLKALPGQFRELQEELKRIMSRMADQVNETTRFGNEAVKQHILEVSASLVDNMEVFRKAVTEHSTEAKDTSLAMSQDIKQGFERSAGELGDMIRSVQTTFYDGLVREKAALSQDADMARSKIEESAAELDMAVRDLRSTQAEALQKQTEQADFFSEVAKEFRQTAKAQAELGEHVSRMGEAVDRAIVRMEAALGTATIGVAVAEADQGDAPSQAPGPGEQGGATPESMRRAVAALKAMQGMGDIVARLEQALAQAVKAMGRPDAREAEFSLHEQQQRVQDIRVAALDIQELAQGFAQSVDMLAQGRDALGASLELAALGNGESPERRIRVLEGLQHGTERISGMVEGAAASLEMLKGGMSLLGKQFFALGQDGGDSNALSLAEQLAAVDRDVDEATDALQRSLAKLADWRQDISVLGARLGQGAA